MYLQYVEFVKKSYFHRQWYWIAASLSTLQFFICILLDFDHNRAGLFNVEMWYKIHPQNLARHWFLYGPKSVSNKVRGSTVTNKTNVNFSLSNYDQQRSPNCTTQKPFLWKQFYNFWLLIIIFDFWFQPLYHFNEGVIKIN